MLIPIGMVPDIDKFNTDIDNDADEYSRMTEDELHAMMDARGYKDEHGHPLRTGAELMGIIRLAKRAPKVPHP